MHDEDCECLALAVFFASARLSAVPFNQPARLLAKLGRIDRRNSTFFKVFDVRGLASNSQPLYYSPDDEAPDNCFFRHGRSGQIVDDLRNRNNEQAGGRAGS